MMKLPGRLYLFFHLLSLDVVLGAAGGYAFACRVLQQDISLEILLVLGFAVWIIYLTDHLLDSAKVQNSSLLKYRLYLEYRKYISLLLMMLFGAGLVMVIAALSFESVIAGLVMGGFVLLYLTGQHLLSGELRKLFPKEIIITVIYIAAIWIIPLLQTGVTEVEYQPYMFLHFLLVLANVSLFTLFEKSEDLNTHKDSFFGAISVQQLRTIIVILVVVVFTGSLVLLQNGIYYVLPFLIISVVYLLESFFSQRGFITRYYAIITDGVFLLFLIFV